MWIYYILKKFFILPLTYMYFIYDYLCVHLLKLHKKFNGFGIHLYVGKFGTGKTSAMVATAYKLCKKYKDLSIVTNLSLKKFPSQTKILPLNTSEDIINAPNDCLVLIDEIGTIFNSRDFSSGARVPKSVYQHLCQCRKKRIMILATVQRYNLLDKQIRDISADVTSCHMFLSYPYSRLWTLNTYDTDDWELAQSNPMYKPLLLKKRVFHQKNLYRDLYDTTQLIDSLLDKKYISDDDILKNRGDSSVDLNSLNRRENRRVNHARRSVQRVGGCGSPFRETAPPRGD